MERHGGEQSRQTEEMVAVEVREKYMVQTAEFQPHAPHLQLGTFTAVDHEQAVAVVYDLRGRLVSKRGHCGSAAQYVDGEFAQCQLFWLMWTSSWGKGKESPCLGSSS